jgi:two-component system alkaline phosphatase synthesis response regulator PhoP
MKIVIVEDDENIREIVMYALGSAGFEACGYETGAEMFTALEDGCLRLLFLI